MMNTEKYKSKYPDAHTVYRGWKLKDGKIVFDANGQPVEALVFAGGRDITLANKMSRIKEDYPIYFSQNDVV